MFYSLAGMMNYRRAIGPLPLVDYLSPDHLTLGVVVQLMKRGLGGELIGTTIKIVLYLTVTLTASCLECHYKLIRHLDVL